MALGAFPREVAHVPLWRYVSSLARIDALLKAGFAGLGNLLKLGVREPSFYTPGQQVPPLGALHRSMHPIQNRLNQPKMATLHQNLNSCTWKNKYRLLTKIILLVKEVIILLRMNCIIRVGIICLFSYFTYKISASRGEVHATVEPVISFFEDIKGYE